MKKIFIDTETTDLEPGEIIQLTYCVCDINSKGEDKVSFAKNFFFNVDYIEESAKAIHGFSVERLKVLSKGKKFKDLALEISSDLNDGIFIAHNVNFDKKFVTAEFNRLNNINWYPKDFFCTMEYFKPIVKATTKTGKLKKPRLEETIDFFNIDKKVVLNGAKNFLAVTMLDFMMLGMMLLLLYLVIIEQKN